MSAALRTRLADLANRRRLYVRVATLGELHRVTLSHILEPEVPIYVGPMMSDDESIRHACEWMLAAFPLRAGAPKANRNASKAHRAAKARREAAEIRRARGAA